MKECEERSLPYLFKLRFTKGVKALVTLLHHQGGRWEATGDGWEAIESTLRLDGWSQERRVIIVREASASAPVEENPKHRARPGKRPGKDQDRLPGLTPEECASPAPWSGKLSVVVTSLPPVEYPLLAIAQTLPRPGRYGAGAQRRQPAIML